MVAGLEFTQGDLLQHVQEHANGLQGSEDRDIVLDGAAADSVAVQVAGLLVQVDGVDHVFHMALAEGLVDLVTAFAELLEGLGADPVLLEELGRALGCLDVEAQVVEAADERERLLLVLVRDGGEDGPVGLDVHAGRLQGLVQGAVQ